MSGTRLRKRSFGGWEVCDGPLEIGWVIRLSDGLWHAFVSTGRIKGREVGWGFLTRREAVDEVEIRRELR